MQARTNFGATLDTSGLDPDGDAIFRFLGRSEIQTERDPNLARLGQRMVKC